MACCWGEAGTGGGPKPGQLSLLGWLPKENGASALTPLAREGGGEAWAWTWAPMECCFGSAGGAGESRRSIGEGHGEGEREAGAEAEN